MHQEIRQKQHLNQSYRRNSATVTSIANQTKEVNTSIDSIKIEAIDNSGQTVTNKVSGLPAGVIFDSETNTIQNANEGRKLSNCGNNNRRIR